MHVLHLPAVPKSPATPRKNQLPFRPGMFLCVGAVTLALGLPAMASAPSPDTRGSVESYLDLPLHELLSMEVTTVSRKEQSIAETAAAVFVITQDDIRRSGVTHIPELLRMVPGFQVARVDANTWAVSSRGFNSNFANKLLVLIDGRTVYTPSFAGVYWDVQDALLADVERIEVVRGPGAALWGANAVNGIVNIITKAAVDTQGGLVSVGGGNEDRGTLGLRYGGQLGEQTDGRAYLKFADHDAAVNSSTGSDAGDDWQSARGGFRLDGQLNARHRWTLQGDVYDQQYDQRANQWQTTPPFITRTDDSAEASGWNLLARWEADTSDTGTASLQLYYDHTSRDEAFLEQTFDTFDIDFQHRFEATEHMELIWGLAYRVIEDDFQSSFTLSVTPEEQTHHIWSAFVQGEVEVVEERLRLTVGSKFEDNEYTGAEYQPSIRLLWTPDQQHSAWGAVSRAVRTPSRLEDSGQIVSVVAPVPFPPGFAALSISGDGDFEAEKLIAYELGYRFTDGHDLAFDAAVFFNQYDDVQTIDATSPTTSRFANSAEAESYGLELAMDWRPLDWWRLQGAYTWFQLDLDVDANSTDTSTGAIEEGTTPEHQLSLRSSMNLASDWELDLWARYVDRVPVASISALNTGISIDGYVTLDARVGWRPRKNLELSLTGRNLLDSHHMEFIDQGLTAPAEIERSIYGELRLTF